jgi:uncharacterized protein
MTETDYISIIRNFALENSKKDDIHGFNHVERVYNMCIKIGEKLDANIELLKISSLLHDIGRIDEKKDKLKRNHAEISAEKALKFLTSKNFNISKDYISNIIQSIKAHSFSNNNLPNSLEAKILSDVDKIDALGAIGLYRAIGFTVKNNGNLNNVIKHLEEKILKLKDSLYLEISRKVAEQRHKIVLQFYKEVINELDFHELS